MKKRSCFILLMAAVFVIGVVGTCLCLTQTNKAEPIPEPVVKEVKAGDEEFVLGGTWEYPAIASTSVAGNTVTYTGTFTQIAWYGQADNYEGPTIVRIDGTVVTETKPTRGDTNDNCLIYNSPILERGEHVFQLECKGEGWLSVQKLVVTDDPAEQIVKTFDDTAAEIQYNGFGAFTGTAEQYQQTVHSSAEKDAFATITLENVRRFVVYGDKDWGRAIGEFYIDGVKVDTVDWYDGCYIRTPQVIFVSPVLSDDGPHTLRIVHTGEKNANATQGWVTIDKIDAYLWREPVSGIDFDDASLGYSGNWQTFSTDDSYYMSSAHSTQTAGDEMTAVFSGITGLRLYASKAPDRRTADIWLNGKHVATVDERSTVVQPSSLLWDSGPLPEGQYELRVVVGGGDGAEWFEIDKIQTDGIDKDNMIIHSGNTSFLNYSQKARMVADENAVCGKYLLLTEGEYLRATVRASKAELVFFPNGSTGKALVSVDGGEPREVISDGTGVRELLEGLAPDAFHRIDVTVTEGQIAFDYMIVDDETLQTIETAMRLLALAEIKERKDGTREVSLPSSWIPVDYSAEKPVSGVTLSGGPMEEMFERNLHYLSESILKTNYVDVTEWWVTTLQNSNEGRMLAGLANSLAWTENEDYESVLSALLARIRERQIANGNGYCLSYPEEVLAGNSDSAEDERRNYDRTMFVKGLVAAGNYYHNKGTPVEDNVAYTILREFFDWYNYNANAYGESMLEGVLGLQGHIAGTSVYFTPIGKTEDMTYSELCYVQNWWLEALASEIPESIWKYPLNRSHCYITTGIDAYLDHYRATGDAKYLNACLGYWNMMHENFVHEGGAMAICEFGHYYPKSYYLESDQHTGELCGTAFWIDFNYKLLQLFPNEEKYALEIEEGIYNILRCAQDEDGKIRYHARYNGQLDQALNVNTCCEVNGAALLARLPEFIYLLEENGVRVNLYEGSSLDVTYGGKHFALTQTADIFSSDTSEIIITGDDMQLVLRVPSWNNGFAVTVNDVPYSGEVPQSGYMTLSVKTGDVIRITAVKELKSVEYQGANTVEGKSRFTFVYGPLLLATRVNSASEYQYSYTAHSYSANGKPEMTIDTEMSLDAFVQNLTKKQNACWEYSENGATIYSLVPYGDLGKYDFFAVYPLFGGEKKEPITVSGDQFSKTFESMTDLGGFECYSSSAKASANVRDGAIVTSSYAEHKFICDTLFGQKEFSASVTVRLIPSQIIDVGIYFNASHAGDAQDKINALNLQAWRRSDSDLCALNLYEFSSDNGYIGMLVEGGQIPITGEMLTVNLVVKDTTVYGYLNGELLLVYELSDSLGAAQTGIRTQAAKMSIVDFSVTAPEAEENIFATQSDETGWLSGNGAPAFSARDGAMYLDSLTADVYRYDGGEWVRVMNIKGEEGTPGINGDNTVTEDNGSSGAPLAIAAIAVASVAIVASVAATSVCLITKRRKL